MYRRRPGPGRRYEHRRRHEIRHPARDERIGVILDFMRRGNPFDPHPEHKGPVPLVQLVGFNRFTLLDGIPLSGEPSFYEKISLSFPYTMAGTKMSCVEVVRSSVACYTSNYRADITTLESALKNIAKFSGARVFTDMNVFSKYVEAFGMPVKIVEVHHIPLKFDDLTSVAKDNLKEAISRIIREREQEFVRFFNIAGPISLRLHTLELLKGIGKKTLRSLLDARKMKGGFNSFKEIEELIRADPVEILADKIIAEIQGTERYYLFVRPPPPSRTMPQTVYLGYLEKIRGQ
ncbi:MAG: DUF655 domain-containing protein [Desulfurococcales archaeon]|nr:DUF655 domain-containing protein [Desulfurococcales archaeon]